MCRPRAWGCTRTATRRISRRRSSRSRSATPACSASAAPVAAIRRARSAWRQGMRSYSVARRVSPFTGSTASCPAPRPCCRRAAASTSRCGACARHETAPYDGRILGHRSLGHVSAPMPRLLSWLVLACALAAAVPAQGAEPIFPLGLRIGLVPPPGLVASTTFQGFEDREHSVAMILTEMPPDAYGAMEQTFTVDALKAKGIEAEQRQDVTLKDGRGFIVVARQQAGGAIVRKWLLIAGTSTLTAVITLQVPEAAAAA